MVGASAGLPRYEDAVQRFRIEDEVARLSGDQATGINAYVECERQTRLLTRNCGSRSCP